MKKLIAVIVFVGVVLLLAFTCPDKETHQETIRIVVSNACKSKMNELLDEKDKSSDFIQGLSDVGLVMIDKLVESRLDTELEVKNYVLFSVGKIKRGEEKKLISFGILNNVFTLDEEDAKKIIDKYVKNFSLRT